MYTFVLSSSAPMTHLIRTGAIEGIDALIRNAEESLVKIENYFHNNRLLLNTRKARIHINYRIIVPSKSIKKLGVHFDNHMLFTSHMDAIRKKKITIPENLSIALRISVITIPTQSIMT